VKNVQIQGSSKFGTFITFSNGNTQYYGLLDVCRVLNILTTDAKPILSEEGLIVLDEKTPGINNPTTFINEDNLYRLILNSNTVEAQNVKKTITSKILPRVARYSDTDFAEVLDDPDSLINLFLDMGELQIKDAVLLKKFALNEFKIKYFDKLVGTKKTYDYKMLAEELGYPNIGKAEIIDILRCKNILKEDGTPYQKYLDLQYFVTLKTENTLLGNTRIFFKTVVTDKGKNVIKKIIDSYLGEKNE
jgi:phage antirepressor YoqD-like protein